MTKGEEQGAATRNAIVRAMRDYQAAHGLPATVRQIGVWARPGRPMGTGLVGYHLRRLEAEGMVRHTAGQARTYRVLPPASAPAPAPPGQERVEPPSPCLASRGSGVGPGAPKQAPALGAPNPTAPSIPATPTRSEKESAHE